MDWLQNLPIKRKLTLVVLVSCSAALLLACGGLAGYESIEFRRAMVRDMTVLANVLANNTRAALAFQDENAAHDTLKALEAEPDVMAACLYATDSGRFADYSRAEGAAFPAQPGPDGARFEGNRLVLVRPVILDQKRLGTLYLETSLAAMYARLRLFGGVAVLVLLGSFLAAFVLSARLQRPISGPILDLAETARVIADRKDYSVRARLHGRDETGLLTVAFNQMLAGIEEREKALREEIAERKGAESRVQSQLARLELMHRITRAIGERQDLKSIFQVVIRTLEDQLPLDFTCICLGEQGAEALTVASVGVKSEALAMEVAMTQQSRLNVEENGFAACMSGRLVYEPDIRESPSPFPRRLAGGGLGAMVAAPLLVESKVFGILIACRRQPNSFNSSECEFLRQLSGHVALGAHQTQLHASLQQAYDDLRQTQQVVMQQERLRALGQMASGIAHDINNAISPVALYTESLLETEPNLSARARNYLGTIQHAIDDVAQTVARMREFYRQRTPQLTLAPVALNRLLQQVLDLSRARWSDMPQQKGIVIEVASEPAADLPNILGVESEIREALVNLIFNAVDAMPEGGKLTLRTRLAASAPAAGGEPAVGHVHVEVGDTGVGMSEDTRRRCLEPFFTTKGERGTGLGLAMVYGIAQRHGAEIEIDSVVGKGTTIRLVFPLPAVAAAEPAAAAAAALPPRLRILVVDDDPLLIKSLRDILETDGHDVVTANGGQEGINSFRASHGSASPFAVVITDLGMPYVDGRKVASSVKEISRSTPVIMLTGWGQRLVAEGDVPADVDQVLNKPPKLRELRAALVRCLRPAA